MIYVVLDFIIFFILILEVFLNTFNLDIAISVKKIFTMFLLEILIISILSYFFPDYSYIFKDIIVGINACCIFKEGIVKTLATYTLIYTCIWELEAGLYDLVLSTLNYFNITEFDYIFIDYLVAIFILLLYTFLTYIRKKHTNSISKKVKRYTFWIFIFVQIIIFVIIVCFEEIFYDFIEQNHLKYYSYTYRTSSFVSLIFTLLGFTITYIAIKNIQYKEIIKANSQLLVQQKIYFENMIKNEEATRKLRHDLKHHIVILNQYIFNKEYDKAMNYINTMEAKLPFYSSKYLCNNIIIDSILSVYQKQFDDNKITVTIKGKYPSDIEINDFDLCVIFSNLLLNAIEACIKVEDNRKINIFINSYGFYVNIIIKNTYKTVSKTLHTLKKDITNHGLGLQNVRDSVENNNGKIEISYYGNTFCVDVLLQGEKH